MPLLPVLLGLSMSRLDPKVLPLFPSGLQKSERTLHHALLMRCHQPMPVDP
jgi:hypothetical protein